MAKISSAEAVKVTKGVACKRRRSSCSGGGGRRPPSSPSSSPSLPPLLPRPSSSSSSSSSWSPLLPPPTEGERGGGVEEEEEDIGREKSEMIGVKIDAHYLECFICCEPFRPPLYQCQNGHVVCFSCWSKRDNRCYTCSDEGNCTRNIWLEKIMESIKVSCSYAKWGCPESINYAQKTTHEEMCIFAPSKCPFRGCIYKGCKGLSPNHFVMTHRKTPKGFKYNQLCKINVPTREPFMVLIAGDDYVGKHVFLLLNNNFESVGCALSLVCLQSGVSNWQFSYDIRVNTGNGPVLQFKANVGVIKEWKRVHPTDASLMLSSDFCNSDGEFVLDLCIRKTGSSAVKKSCAGEASSS